MNAAVFAYSRTGIQTAKRVSLALHDMDVSLYTLARLEEPGFLPIEPSVYALEFSRRDALIFVGACGIAVREIAPYVRDKKTDPAVLVLDERARHVIPRPLVENKNGGRGTSFRFFPGTSGARTGWLSGYQACSAQTLSSPRQRM